MTPGAGAWPALRAGDFSAGTPLCAFFAWNEAQRWPDRRYTIACDLYHLYRRFGGDRAGTAACVSHLAMRPLIRRRSRPPILAASPEDVSAPVALPGFADGAATVAARQVVSALLASIGTAEAATHAAFFKAFEEFSRFVDLDALAARRPRRVARSPSPVRRRILVIKLSALGDFVQALGPAAAIRRHHAADEITLLTTGAFAQLAQQSGFFDRIMLDWRPKPFDVVGWMALRRILRTGGFARVYDLQTSDRSSLYAWLFLPGRRPEWSGIAWHCSHPHANLGRFPQHTIDKQAEQLLMAGIYPTPLPACPVSARPLPGGLQRRGFFLLIPGSSPRHPEKRWPARRYGALARRLAEATGVLPVIVGALGEEPLAATIRAACPAAIDLVGRTELTGLADLADAAAFSIGNDTGATHIAAAGGNPVVVLFSEASDPSRCAPRGREIHVLSCPNLNTMPISRVFTRVIQVYNRLVCRPLPIQTTGDT
jgi:ADP-heptose:LPS heptosyltransferase